MLIDFINIIAILISTGLGMIFLYILTTNWKLPAKTVKLIYIVLLTIGTVANLLVLNWTGSSHYARIFASIFSTLVVAGSYFLMIEYQKGRSLFILFSSYTLILAVSAISEVAADDYTVRRMIVKLTVFLIVSFLLYRYFRKPLAELTQEFQGGWYNLTLVPISLSVIYLLLLVPGTLYTDRRMQVVALLLAFITCSNYIALYHIFSTAKRQFSELTEYEVLKEQMHSLQKQAETLQESDEQINIFRHDTRHYLRLLNSCISEGNLESADQILKSMDNNLNNLECKSKQYTGNLLIDSILSDYSQRAANHGIEFQAHLQLTSILADNLMNLSIIIANGLENALNACLEIPPEKKRAIILIGHERNQHFFLSIENTYYGTIQFSDSLRRPITDKKNHGYGTKSIFASAKDMGAEASFTTQSEWFQLRLIL